MTTAQLQLCKAKARASVRAIIMRHCAFVVPVCAHFESPFFACLCQPLLQETRAEDSPQSASDSKIIEEELASSGAMDLDIKLQRLFSRCAY